MFFDKDKCVVSLSQNAKRNSIIKLLPTNEPHFWTYCWRSL